MQLPRVPVSDAVGEVAAVGPGVSRLKVGQRVAGLLHAGMDRRRAERRQGVRSALGGDCDGLLAEYAVLPEDGVVSVPDHLSDEEAATLPCAAVTACARLLAGYRSGASGTGSEPTAVLVQGTGGVSLFALQFALPPAAG